MVRTVLAHGGALLVLILTIVLGVNLEEASKNPVSIGLIVLAILATAALAGWDVYIATRQRPISFKGRDQNDKIREYMKSLIETDRRCIVSSNDLSWVRGDVREIMLTKARGGSLELVMPIPSPLSAELAAAGATVHYYGDAEFRFRSRFTLVNSDSADSWVAIGQRTSKTHLIREVHVIDNDPTLHLAKDLIDLARRAAAVRLPS